MKSFRLKNTKSFIDSGDIEIKPITIFVGKNSSGKSSLMRFPVVLSQTFQDDVMTPLLLFGNLIDYGNYNDVVNNHKETPISFELNYGRELQTDVNNIYMLNFRNISKESIKKAVFQNVRLTTTIAKVEKRIVVQESTLFIDKQEACTIERKMDGNYLLVIKEAVVTQIAGEKREYLFQDVKLRFNRFFPQIDEDNVMEAHMRNTGLTISPELNKQILWGFDLDFEEENEDVRQIANLVKVLRFVNTFFQALFRRISREASSLIYIGPFRESPQRVYRDSENNYSEVGTKGEYAGLLLRQDAQGNGQVIKEVSGWFKNAMDVELGVQDAGNSMFSVIVKSKNQCEDNIIDTGYGISQVLPIVTQLLSDEASLSMEQRRYMGMNRKTMFVIEQPELHLHPAAQSQLADLFVENFIKNRSRRLLIETHSEHLIRKLQVLIADPEIEFDNDQIAVYYVDKDENNNSVVSKMELSESGQFVNVWPEGFFDKGYELTRLLMEKGSRR